MNDFWERERTRSVSLMIVAMLQEDLMREQNKTGSKGEEGLDNIFRFLILVSLFPQPVRPAALTQV